MPNWDEIRTHFPALSNCTYLNTAGGCALSTDAANAGRQYFDEMENDGDVCWPQWLKRTETVRAQFASYVGASPDEIAFVNNASLAMNFAEKYAPAGDVMLVGEDFPSVTLPWLAAGRKAKFFQPNKNGEIELSKFAECLSDSVSSVAIGHVNYSTGYSFNLNELSTFCRERNLFLVVDATQSLGAIPIDVSTTSVDCLLLSGYKWSTAGYGIGVLYLKKQHLRNRSLPVAGWRSAKVPYEMRYDRLEASDSVAALELGHPPFPGIFALGGALELLSQIGQNEIFERIPQLSDFLLDELTNCDGVTVRSVSDRYHRSGITMLEVAEPQAVCDALKQRNIFISVRNGLLRVSVHFYNSKADIYRFVSELRTIL